MGTFDDVSYDFENAKDEGYIAAARSALPIADHITIRHGRFLQGYTHFDFWLDENYRGENCLGASTIAGALAALDLPEEQLIGVINILRATDFPLEGRTGIFQYLSNLFGKKIRTLNKLNSSDGHIFSKHLIGEYFPNPEAGLKPYPTGIERDSRGFIVNPPLSLDQTK